MRDDLIRAELLLTRRVFAASMAAAAMVGVSCKKKGKESTSPTAGLSDAFKEVKKRIKKAVEDKDRRKAAIEVYEKIESKILGLNKISADWRSELGFLTDEQKDDRALLVQITEKHSGRIVDALGEVAQLAVDLRQHIQAAEWPQVFPRDQKEAA